MTKVSLLALITALAVHGSSGSGFAEETRPSVTVGDAASQPDVRGGTAWTPTGLWEAIGTIGGCTATLVSPHAALTAGHCVTDGETRTFRLPNDRGTIDGRAILHPLYGLGVWQAYDYAVIRFDRSIFEDPAVDTHGIRPMPVSAQTLSAGNVVILYGFGGFGTGGCTGWDGEPRWARAQVASVGNDWHYQVTSSAVGLCPGDSGGPLLSADGRTVVGVNSWIGGESSYAKSSYMAYDWIKQNIGATELPAETWGNCVYYQDGVDGAWFSARGNHASFAAWPGWNDAISSIWVKKGFNATLYDQTNFVAPLATFDGFNGDNCNEFGCAYDLRETLGADNATSSTRCQKTLPQDTWGYCVYYDRYGDGNYYSTRSDAASFDTTPFWNNRISQIWVKNGKRAEVFPKPSYQGDRYSSIIYEGDSGDWCNTFGCLHDLVGSAAENTVSSATCR